MTAKELKRIMAELRQRGIEQREALRLGAELLRVALKRREGVLI